VPREYILKYINRAVSGRPGLVMDTAGSGTGNFQAAPEDYHGN